MNDHIFFFFIAFSIFIQNNIFTMHSNAKKNKNSLFSATWNYCTQQRSYNHTIWLTVCMQYRKNPYLLEIYDKDRRKIIDTVYSHGAHQQIDIDYKSGKLVMENEFVILRKLFYEEKSFEHFHYPIQKVNRIETEMIFSIVQKRFSNKQGFKDACNLVNKMEQEMLPQKVRIKLDWKSCLTGCTAKNIYNITQIPNEV